MIDAIIDNILIIILFIYEGVQPFDLLMQGRLGNA